MKSFLSILLHTGALRHAGCSAALLLGLGVASPVWAAAPFTVNANGTVTDSMTGLVWDQCPVGMSSTTTACDTGSAGLFTWAVALSQAVTANAANGGAGYKGITDWRLPNVNELESISNIGSYTANVPTTDGSAFPNTPPFFFSTSTNYAPDANQAWVVYFGSTGGDVVGGLKNTSRHVRLVRGGSAFDVLQLPVNGACVTDQTLTVAPSNPNLCTAGTAGVVTANPASYTWACLGSNGGSDAPSCSAVRNYVVTSSVTGGNGAISASQNVAYNATPSFTLTPASGYVASAITGTCGGSLSANSFTTNAVTAPCAVVASFTAAPVTSYVLDVSKTGTGSGTVTSDTGGINCGATCSASYTSGATVTLAAAAASNSTFTGWSGACTGTASCVVSLSAARSVVAGFDVTPVPTGAVAPIPTLSEWAMILLATLMSLLGLAQVRRKPD